MLAVNKYLYTMLRYIHVTCSRAKSSACCVVLILRVDLMANAIPVALRHLSIVYKYLFTASIIPNLSTGPAPSSELTHSQKERVT